MNINGYMNISMGTDMTARTTVKIRPLAFLPLALLVCALCAFGPRPAQAQTVPGSSCDAAGSLRSSGGPDLAGGGHLLVCDGTAWQSILTFNREAEITKFGNQTCDDGEILKFNGTIVTCGLDVGLEDDDTTSCADPSPPIGTQCADGSIYAGMSPDGNIKMYAAATDGPALSWDNGAGALQDTPMTNCTSARSQTSCRTGAANTALLAGLSGAASPFLAARYCDGLTAHGHSDWYLPAINELAVVYFNRLVIGGFSPIAYWSSSEAAPSPTTRAYAMGQYASFGTYDEDPASVAKGIRCVRK